MCTGTDGEAKDNVQEFVLPTLGFRACMTLPEKASCWSGDLFVFFCFIFMVLKIKPRTSHMLSKGAPTDLDASLRFTYSTKYVSNDQHITSPHGSFMYRITVISLTPASPCHMPNETQLIQTDPKDTRKTESIRNK